MRNVLTAAAEQFRRGMAPISSMGNMVAVGGTTIRTFIDGIETDFIPDATQVWTDVAVANGKICAVSYVGKKIAVKDISGGSWQVILPPVATDTQWRGITAVGDRFFMYGFSTSDNAKLISTEDFVNWQVHALTDSTNEDYNKLSSYNGQVLIPPRTINRVKSMDAITGVQVSYPVQFGAQSYYPFAFKVVNEKAFALGQGRKVSVASISNGIINNDFDLKVGLTQSSHSRDVEYIEELGLYVVVGSFGTGYGTSPLVYTSTDAHTFTVMPNVSTLFGSSNALQSIVKKGDSLYIGSNDGRIFKTSDMVNFDVFSTLPGRVENIKVF